MKYRAIAEGGLWLAYEAGSVVTRAGEAPLLRMPMAVEVKQVGDAQSRVLRFVASTEDEDRDGDIIRADGWDVGNFLKNPVQLWAHNMRVDHPPIGKTVKLEVGNGKLINEVDFFMAGDFELARLALKAHLAGVGAESVGFRPMKATERRDGQGRLTGFVFEEQELLEISSVPVPSNPNALLVATQKGLLKPEEAQAIEKAFAPQLVKPIRLYLMDAPGDGNGDAATRALLAAHEAKHHATPAEAPEVALAVPESTRAKEGLQTWLDAEEAVEVLWPTLCAVKQEERPQAVVQTLIFSKEKFETAEAAKAWAKAHDFRSDKVDETDESWRLRQRDPGDFQEGSFRTITLTEGVKAVIGRLKQKAAMLLGDLDLKAAAAHAATLDEAGRRVAQRRALDLAEIYGLSVTIETTEGTEEDRKAIETLTKEIQELQAQLKNLDAVIAGTVRDAVGAAAGR